MADKTSSTELVETKSSNESASADGKLSLPKPESKADLGREKSSVKPDLGKQKSKAPKNNKGDLDAQTKAFSEKGTIFSSAYAGDAECFFGLVDNQNWDICQQVGPVGDCPFLVLFLIHSPTHLEMARKCVNEYQKKLIFSEYKPERPGPDGEGTIPCPLYFGETALHLCVVNKNEEFVDFLLQTQKELHAQGECLDLDLLKMPAQGVFFAPPLTKGPCYYGEVPLGFAACTANVSMCQKLLHTYDADLQFADSYGNNLLHLLAMHNLPDMFKYILQEEKASAKAKEKDYVPLAIRKNKEGLTPLSLAAASGNKEVFGAIIDASKVTVWTYGPIEMIKFPLAELDTLDLKAIDKLIKGEVPEEGDDRTGTIELLIREGNLELLMQNVLIDILDNKWTRYAFRRYLLRCVKQSVLIISVTLSLILGYPDPANYSLSDANLGTSSVFRIIFELIVVYMCATKGFSEMQEMRGAGLRDYYGDVGVAFLENALSSSYCFFIFCVVIVRIVGITLRAHYINVEGSNSTHVFGDTWATMGTADPNNNFEFPDVTQYADIFLQSISVMLIYFYAITLLLGFRLTGQFVIMIYKMLRNDVLRFCMVFFLFILGFGTSYLALQSVPYPNPVTGWSQMFDNCYGLFQVLTGGLDFSFTDMITATWGRVFQGIGAVIQVFFSIVMTIMLLNLLIAMMGDTYGIVKAATEMEYVQYKAQIIMSLENEMSASDWKKIAPYWIMDNGQPWLQMQIKNQQFLQNNSSVPVMAPPPVPVQSAEEKFKGADVDGDGNVSQGELEAFEKDLRAKLELEFLQRVALGNPQLPATQPSLFVNASEIKGNGFAREGVYSVDGN